MATEVATLTRLINSEVIRAMGLPPEGWAGRRLQPALSRATRRFSELFAAADRMIGDEGLVSAARVVLLRLSRDFHARGIQNIPHDGPVLLASNHPGAADSVAIGATAGRNDLKIIASDVPFLTSLTQIGRHLIFLPRQGIQARALALREAIRHLQAGGAVLVFAHGTIDPDPAFMPGAELELNGWSRSLEVFLDKVPETRVVSTIVSNVLDPGYMRHPLTWLKRARVDRQRLAIMLQIIQQMLGRRLDLVPRVSFGEALEWHVAEKAGDARQTIIEAAQRLMRTHLSWQP